MDCRKIIFIFILLLSYCSTYADNVLQFTADEVNKYIGKYVSIYRDTTGTLSFEDVRKHDDLFVHSQQTVPNLGTDASVSWVKFKVKNLSTARRLIVNFSHTTIDEAIFYSVIGDKVDSVRIVSGESIKDREYPHQFFLFELPLPNGAEATCYLKLKSSTPLLAPISIHTTKTLWRTLIRTDVFSALYLGLMLSMILYNIFLYFSTREAHYYIYVNYIFWVMMAQLAIMGIFEPIFSIESKWISSRLLAFTGAMSGLGAIFFVKSFLNTAVSVPRFDKLLNIFAIGYVIAVVLLIAGAIVPAYLLVNIVAGGGSTIVLILAFRLSRQNYKQTHYFLYAWCIFLVSVLIYVLKDYNILPYNFFTLRSVQIGSVIEAMLLSFALGDKINMYRKEKDASQARELAVSLENTRLVREQNTMLEQKVEERTYALTASNESLQKTLVHLKETQSQLVEAEKMASLGQLTAGVAHEINNPINFVTSNVAPLKRDIKMIWDTLAEVERIALTEGLSTEEKQTRIREYKEDLDIDYLQTEVDFLLKGMHDGAHRTAEIVKSLRIFSRVDEDSLKVADINEGIESTMVILNSLVREEIEVEKSYGEIPKIECHAGKLNQVFLNILTNAIYAINKKFKDGNGGILRIETGIHVDDTNIFIKITDNGIGIPKEIREKIFEPFFTTKDVGEGTGLGMSIAYNTIAKHRGQIIVDSTEGEGTAFILILPVRQNN